MSIVGSICIADDENLDDFIRKPDGNKKYGEKDLYLDSFFYDIHIVFTEYIKNLSSAEFIILGKNIISNMKDGEEVHYAYTKPKEVKIIDGCLQKVSKIDFEHALDSALRDQKSFLHHYNGNDVYREGVVEYFIQIKELYHIASRDDNSTIYVYG